MLLVAIITQNLPLTISFYHWLLGMVWCIIWCIISSSLLTSVSLHTSSSSYHDRYWNNPDIVNRRYSNSSIGQHRILINTNDNNTNDNGGSNTNDYNKTRLNEIITDIKQCNRNIILACENLDSFNEYQVIMMIKW